MGASVTVKLAALAAVPPQVVTLIGPLRAPAGTAAVICTALSTEKLAAVPLKRTAVAPMKPAPMMVTEVPTGPAAGLKNTTAGAGAGAVTVNCLGLAAVPPAVVTVTRPVVAPAGTVAVICAALSTEKLAAAPPKVTAVAPLKSLPVRITEVPTGPEVGVRLVMVGGVVGAATLAHQVPQTPPSLTGR